MHKTGTTIILCLFLLIAALLVMGCGSTGTQDATASLSPAGPVLTNTAAYSSSSPETTAPVTSPAASNLTPTASTTISTSLPVKSSNAPPITPDPVSVQLFLNPLPKPGEVADLTMTVRFNTDYLEYGETEAGLARARAWFSFSWTDIHGSYLTALGSQAVPPEEVVMDGQATSWELNASGKGKYDFKTRIRLPREGIWNIGGCFTGEGWSRSESGDINVAVADGTAALLYTESFKSGPLAYLGNFYYGNPSRLPVEKQLSEKYNPVIFEMDMSRAPHVGEEVLLTCKVYSLLDLSDFSIETRFARITNTTKYLGIQPQDLLVNGSLTWKGDLKKGVFMPVSAIIKLPEEGDWELTVYGISSEKQKNHEPGFSDTITISITAAHSSFGWPDHPVPPGGYKIVYPDPELFIDD